ncbi:MAG: hypothetical protein KAI66_20740 [Lentisphaeria bacterium]|nr:hypothetical protein [Lentisphaeria bacterium]
MFRSAFYLTLLTLWMGTVCADTILSSRDLDGDGQDELILENDFLVVEVMSGVPPPPPPVRLGFWTRTLGGEKKAHRPKYTTRFVWGGWIRNITFKPTDQRWFVDAPHSRSSWQGIPEEFGVVVRTRELADNVYEAIKVGVGVCEGTGLCLRGSLKLVRPATTELAIKNTPRGGKSLLFTQTVHTESGHGYRYVKNLTLEPGSSRLVVVRQLENTGDKPLSTTWYSHAFWGQAAKGKGYDRDSWSTIPLFQGAPSGNPSPYPVVDTMPCHVPHPMKGFYWGPLDASLVAAPWYASGNRATGDLFLNYMSEVPAWYRMWTHADTYSCEPFLDIQLQPGEMRAWTMVRASANGLRQVRTASSRGVLHWSFLPGEKGKILEISFLPFAVETELTVTGVAIAEKIEGSQPVSFRQSLPPCSPMMPARVRFPHSWDSSRYRLHVTVSDADGPILDVSRTSSSSVQRAPSWTGRAAGANALLLGACGKDEKGALKLTLASGFLKEYLEQAGFLVTLANSRHGLIESQLAEARLVILCGVPEMPLADVRALENFVRRGNGLLVTGPLRLRSFEFSDLLPVTGTIADVNISGHRLRDGTRDFIGASTRRYHLQMGERHPALAGLPLYPKAFQNIARLQTVVVRSGATVPANYATPEGLAPVVDAPAVVTQAYGSGRVALTTCPVDWGSPPSWVLWSRLGEYHQQFFAQLALWSCSLDSE